MTLVCCVVDGVDLPFALRVVDTWLADATSRDDLFVANWVRVIASRVKIAAGDTAAGARYLAAGRASWSEIDDDLFAATLLHFDLADAIYEAPARAHELGREIEGRLLKMFVSNTPIGRSGFYMFYGAAIAAGAALGSIGPEEATRRLEAVMSELSLHFYGAPAIDSMRSYLALQGGDREAAARHMAVCADGWTQRRQQLHAAGARLRHAQLQRDDRAVAERTRELRDLGVGEPERYAILLAGPAPPA